MRHALMYVGAFERNFPGLNVATTSFQGSDGQMQTWVDSVEVAGLHEDGVATKDIDGQWLNKVGWKPSLADIKFGWESYGGDDMTLWFDDVALGPARIGCN